MTQRPASLHKLLLVGTARAQFDADGLAPELVAILAPAIDTPGTTPERRLWLATGAQHLWRRAGYLAPASATATASTAAPEQMPACPRAAEAVLGRLLGGTERSALLPEWLRLLNARGARLPERFLPNMLDLASRDAALRPAVQGPLGMRGAWLARLESRWGWANAGSDASQVEQAWHNGTSEERVTALAAWRRVDPAAARAALQSGWSSEPPELRSAFLPCLEIGLEARDEDFLEAALDDRRKAVRLAARDLLARLPGSSLSQRLRAWAAPLLQVERHPVQGARLHVLLPETCSAAMARDGIGDTKHPGLGERAGWLVDMLSLIDPAYWSATLGLSADECLALSASSDYRDALQRGWIAGMQLHLAEAPSAALLAWLAAWTRVWLQANGAAGYQSTAALVGAYTALPAAQLHATLFALVEASGLPWQSADGGLAELVEQLARKSAGTWPAQLSEAIARRLLGALSAMTSHQWSYRTLLSSLATVLDPAAVLAAERAWPGLGPDPHGWQGPVDEFFHVVRFRHEMILSFQESA